MFFRLLVVSVILGIYFSFTGNWSHNFERSGLLGNKHSTFLKVVCVWPTDDLVGAPVVFRDVSHG